MWLGYVTGIYGTIDFLKHVGFLNDRAAYGRLNFYEGEKMWVYPRATLMMNRWYLYF